MFHVMRFSLQAQRALDHRAHAGRGEPLDHLTISPRQALELATIEGARALMMEDRIGSLSPGKQADVILIRADDVAIAPINDPVQAIVLYAGPLPSRMTRSACGAWRCERAFSPGRIIW